MVAEAVARVRVRRQRADPSRESRPVSPWRDPSLRRSLRGDVPRECARVRSGRPDRGPVERMGPGEREDLRTRPPRLGALARRVTPPGPDLGEEAAEVGSARTAASRAQASTSFVRRPRDRRCRRRSEWRAVAAWGLRVRRSRARGRTGPHAFRGRSGPVDPGLVGPHALSRRRDRNLDRVSRGRLASDRVRRDRSGARCDIHRGSCGLDCRVPRRRTPSGARGAAASRSAPQHRASVATR